MTQFDKARSEAQAIINKMTRRPVPTDPSVHRCAWCGRRIPLDDTACHEHEDLDTALRQHREGDR